MGNNNSVSYDNQNTFNIVAAHLLKQKKQSIKEDGIICLYRGPNGLKCAAGALIPDELYNPKMEMSECTVPVVADVLTQCGHDPSFVSGLQWLHDQSFPEEWEDELKSFAGRYNLELPKELNELQETQS